MTLSSLLLYLGAVLSLSISFSFLQATRYAFNPLLRTLLAAIFSLPLLTLDSTLTAGEVSLSNSALYLLERVIHGGLLGLFTVLILETLPLAGRFLDLSRGAQYSEQLIASLGERSSPFQTVGVLLSACVLFSPLGYQFIFTPTFIVPTSKLSLTQSLWALYQLLQSSFAIALLISAPVVIGSFLLDAGSAVLSRYLNRTNMSFELLGVKMCLGILLFALLLPELLFTFESYLREVQDSLQANLLSSGA